MFLNIKSTIRTNCLIQSKRSRLENTGRSTEAKGGKKCSQLFFRVKKSGGRRKGSSVSAEKRRKVPSLPGGRGRERKEREKKRRGKSSICLSFTPRIALEREWKERIGGKVRRSCVSFPCLAIRAKPKKKGGNFYDFFLPSRNKGTFVRSLSLPPVRLGSEREKGGGKGPIFLTEVDLTICGKEEGGKGEGSREKKSTPFFLSFPFFSCSKSGKLEEKKALQQVLFLRAATSHIEICDCTAEWKNPKMHCALIGSKFSAIWACFPPFGQVSAYAVHFNAEREKGGFLCSHFSRIPHLPPSPRVCTGQWREERKVRTKDFWERLRLLLSPSV